MLLVRHALRIRPPPLSCSAARARMLAMASSSTHSVAADSPATVLCFWFGEEWQTNRAALSTPAYFEEQKHMSKWYGGGAAADAACAEWAPVIRAAVSGELQQAWGRTADTRMATVILLDQLARGAFRGTNEAFAGDAVALATAREAYANKDDVTVLSIAERSFLLLPLMHSESLADQDECLRIATALAEEKPELGLLKFTRTYAEDHRAVIHRFGRFPHRNQALGRESTEKERIWLASDDCPGWAKSQTKTA